MPDHRQHRGPHPEDRELFARVVWPLLQSAVEDFSWLLTRGYASPSALKIVGDRYRLTERQRLAVMRSSCSDQNRAARLAKQVTPQVVAGSSLWLDGFNVVTTIEAALAGGAIIAGRDGCYRDMASMHGSYRKVAETETAIRLVGRLLHERCPATPVHWLLDQPVSNSGRMRAVILDISQQENSSWSVELLHDPDHALKQTVAFVATADGNVLDGCSRWLNLTRLVIEFFVPDSWIVPMAREVDAERPD